MDSKKQIVMGLKEQLLRAGVTGYSSIEATIIQVLKDTLGLENSMVAKAERIKKGWEVKCAVAFSFGRATKEEYEMEKFNMYCDLVDEVISYIDLSFGANHKELEDDFESKKLRAFISYCWDDMETANKIDQYFYDKEVIIKRDIRDIGAWKSIREFMESIRTQDYAILIVSERYLKSTSCMYEILEIMKEPKYKERILPVVLETQIYNPCERIQYVKYWENEYRNMEKEVKEINVGNAPDIAMELSRIGQIQATISEFMSMVSDMNNPSVDDTILAIEQKFTEKGSELANQI